MQVETISTKRLLLRPYIESDIRAWQRWDIDPEVQKFLPEPTIEIVTDSDQLVYLQECLEEKDGVYWSIVWNETNEVIGTISLTEMNFHHGVGELGIVIGEKQFWGLGIATESIEAVAGYAKSTLKLRRLCAEYESENFAVQRALEQAGFVLECVHNDSRIKNNIPIDTTTMIRFL